MRAFRLGLIVRGEEEFFEYLTDKVFFLDNSVTSCCVSLGNDFACWRDKTTQELFLLFRYFERLKLVFIIACVISGRFLLKPLLCLNLVNYLVEQFFRVVNCAGIVSCIAKLVIPLGL